MGMIGMSEQSPPQRLSFRKNSSQQTNQETVFTQIFIRNLGLSIICPILFDTYRDFERDKFTGKWCGDMVPEISEEQCKTWIDITGPSDCKNIGTCFS
jgi:hypothetical protein